MLIPWGAMASGLGEGRIQAHSDCDAGSLGLDDRFAVKERSSPQGPQARLHPSTQRVHWRHCRTLLISGDAGTISENVGDGGTLDGQTFGREKELLSGDLVQENLLWRNLWQKCFW